MQAIIIILQQIILASIKVGEMAVSWWGLAIAQVSCKVHIYSPWMIVDGIWRVDNIKLGRGRVKRVDQREEGELENLPRLKRLLQLTSA